MSRDSALAHALYLNDLTKFSAYDCLLLHCSALEYFIVSLQPDGVIVSLDLRDASSAD